MKKTIKASLLRNCREYQLVLHIFDKNLKLLDRVRKEEAVAFFSGDWPDQDDNFALWDCLADLGVRRAQQEKTFWAREPDWWSDAVSLAPVCGVL